MCASHKSIIEVSVNYSQEPTSSRIFIDYKMIHSFRISFAQGSSFGYFLNVHVAELGRLSGPVEELDDTARERDAHECRRNGSTLSL